MTACMFCSGLFFKHDGKIGHVDPPGRADPFSPFDTIDWSPRKYKSFDYRMAQHGPF